MDESLGQQYALQVALQTMKERCLQLQQRLSIVEEENMNLRVKYYVESMEVSASGTKPETEILRQKVTQLTKQKSQLTHNVLMVASENKQLWSRLSKLTQTSQKTEDNYKTDVTSTPKKSPAPNPTTLIRSKTFTHETSPVKLVRKSENDICTDSSLEDISLKIINSIAQEKYELEKQCAQMTEMQNSELFLSSSIGFAYPHDELEDCTVGEIAHNMEKLIYIKDAVIGQKEKLKKGFEFLKTAAESGVMCKSCKETLKKEKESQKIKPKEEVTTASSSKDIGSPDKEKMCPMCSKVFYKELLGEFVAHVESHFMGEDDIFLDNFEVVPSLLRK